MSLQTIEDVSNLKCLETRINDKARRQAEGEWDATMSDFADWLNKHPTKNLSSALHGGYGARSLCVRSRDDTPLKDEDSRKAVAALPSALTSFGKVFVVSRAHHLAEKMAAELLDKANMIP